MPVDVIALKLKLVAFFLIAFIGFGALLFVPAGTLDYMQGWIYLSLLAFPPLLAFGYFLRTDPEFVARRLRMREKEGEQELIVLLGGISYVAGLVVCGLDHRFGWSNVPSWLMWAAGVVAFLAYLLVVYVLSVNRFAGRTIEVEKGQKVISTGPYALVRHPMYAGSIVMFLAGALLLGSYWALVPFTALSALFILRALNEEKVLLRDLKGYKEYCEKTRYRLIPLVW